MISIRNILKLLFLSRFGIDNQRDDYDTIHNSIEQNTVFKGINLWTLVFAIFIASIGLNMNSTAVIIGAMLISPLMGPIIGLGYSVAVFDFDLLKKSFLNLSVAVIISVIASTIYFLISPISDAQSELLSRTTPTIYDVLIALFGGLTGIISGISKDKGNAIPGVAIATALMPPLCTAGYGISSGNLMFFFGAFYLFFINAVMISFSTLITIWIIKLPHRNIVGQKEIKKVKIYISLIVLITVIPSIFFAYKIVKENIFINRANQFINFEMNFNDSQILSKNLKYNNNDSNYITVFIAGKTIDQTNIEKLNKKLIDYNMNDTKLVIKQGPMIDEQKIDIKQLKSGIIEDIYTKNEVMLKNKDEKIKALEKEIISIKSNDFPAKKILDEIKVLYPQINKISIKQAEFYNSEDAQIDTNIIVYLNFNKNINTSSFNKMKSFLEKRLDNGKIKLLVEKSK